MAESQLGSLRKDLLVARTLYKLLLVNSRGNKETVTEAKPVSYEALKKALQEYGMSDRQSSVAIDMLFDQGMLKTEWDDQVRGLQIAGEAASYVRALYEKTERIAA